MLKDSGVRKEFSTGARRDCPTGKGRMDLLPFRALMEVSKLHEAGAIKYSTPEESGDRNWEKGLPTHSYADSAMRHLGNFMCGVNDEPHLVQATWNILCLLDTILRIKDGTLPGEVHDLPFPVESIRLMSNAPIGESGTAQQRLEALFDLEGLQESGAWSQGDQ